MKAFGNLQERLERLGEIEELGFEYEDGEEFCVLELGHGFKADLNNLRRIFEIIEDHLLGFVVATKLEVGDNKFKVRLKKQKKSYYENSFAERNKN